MRFTKIALTAAFAAGAIQAAAAQTTVVDFEDLQPDQAYASQFVTGGLTFTKLGIVGPPASAFYVLGDGANGTQTMLPNYYGTTTRVTAVDDALFTLQSFDFSEAFNFADDPTLQVTFVFDTTDGIVNRTLTPDSTVGMQTATFNISGISSFTFVTSNSTWGENTIQTDNWTYSLDAAGGVPEPATWTMMILGFGAIGGSLRRRNAVRVRYA